MKHLGNTIAMVACTWLATSACATPVQYNIAFDPGTKATPTGSFYYDSSLPIDQQFSHFIVLAQSGVFDLTSAANNFTFRTDAGTFAASCASQTGVNDAFLMLTDAPCVASEATGFQWGLGNGAHSDPFRFLADSMAPGQTEATDFFEGAPTSGAYSFDFGNGYLATAVPQAASGVPEPAMTGLLGCGMLGLFLARIPARRKRR